MWNARSIICHEIGFLGMKYDSGSERLESSARYGRACLREIHRPWEDRGIFMASMYLRLLELHMNSQ
jgi:hypothetical protein